MSAWGGEGLATWGFSDEMQERLEQLVRNGAFDDKEIVLFGASIRDGSCKRWLESQGFTVAAVIDNSKEKIGREYMGVTVMAPEDALVPFNSDRVILITSPLYWPEMTYQVVQMGYSKGTQVFSVGASARKPRWAFVRQLIHVAKGAIRLRKLARGGDGKRTVFLTPIPPAGDVYVECLFVRAVARKIGIERFVIAVPNAACKRVVEMFGFEVVVLEEPHLYEIIDYVRFARRGAKDMVAMHFLSLNGSIAQIEGYKGLNFEKMFRYGSFDLDDEVRHDVPSAGSDPDGARSTLVSNGLTPGHTVILAPYARSLVHGHHAEFWEALAADLTARGYDVCTSGFGAEEPAIPGTPLLQFPFSEAVQFVETAGFFVGLRSGLCDVISPAEAVKVILHERGPYFKTSLFGMFSLNAMGLCDDAIEFEFSSSEMDAILGDVVAVFS